MSAGKLSSLWCFLKPDETHVATGLKIVICITRSELGEHEETLLRNNLDDLDVGLAVKMLEN
jgi:hypothetical protein